MATLLVAESFSGASSGSLSFFSTNNCLSSFFLGNLKSEDLYFSLPSVIGLQTWSAKDAGKQSRRVIPEGCKTAVA